jgi:hypothetical protein
MQRASSTILLQVNGMINVVAEVSAWRGIECQKLNLLLNLSLVVKRTQLQKCDYKRTFPLDISFRFPQNREPDLQEQRDSSKSFAVVV